MGKLKVLPTTISNLIAAGEVVQRPSSVIKELLENSVDAGADTISVVVEDAGRTSMQIVDNGVGMEREEALLSFQRHATSKISEVEDLSSIMTYGFRGEALASIAAVAEVTLRSRKRGTQTGSEVVVSGGEFLSDEEVASPEGTNITVRNLFYNVPARRKFLKSDNAEFRQILSEFSRVALCRPELNLSLLHNGKEVYNLKRVSAVKQRIMEIEGKSMAKELVDISFASGIMTVSGFIGRPEDVRKNSGNQFFFVNGRYFKSPYFHKAVMKGYEKMIPEGVYPSYYLFFEVSPKNIDVNISPSKTEVKFENESEIFELLTALVKESLGKNSFVPTIDFDHDTLPDIPLSRKFKFPSRINDKITDYSPILPSADGPSLSSGQIHSAAPAYGTEQTVEGYGEIFDDRESASDNILQFMGRYLVTTMRSGLLVINIRRAKERIFYERYLANLDNSLPIAQQILFPCTIELSPMNFSILMEDQERLKLMGFDIVPFGPFTVAVNGLPEGFSPDEKSAMEAVEVLIELFSESGSDALATAQAREKIARGLALSAASGSSSKITTGEARLLVDMLFACAQPERSPSGKKTMEMIKEEDIEKIL